MHSELKYLVCSDIHLGHRKTPTLHIANSFRKCILNKHNKDVKIIFIGGDLFDRLLDVNSKDILIILELMDQLLNYCYVNNIKLRVLEGTPSHDWNQPQILAKLNDLRTENKPDLRYFKNLDIEFMPEENKHVLYIPDEWTHCHDSLEKQIQEKLNQYAISQVDIAIMHGQFQYQFAGIPYTGFYFRENYFLNLVKGFIHVGHYHNYTTFDRIVANGSLERLAHRQEEDKGYVVVNGNSYTFIKNEDAYTYKTIPVTKRSTLNTLDKAINLYPPNSYLRIQMTRDHPFNTGFQELKLRYMDQKLERLVKGDDTDTGITSDVLSDNELEVLDSFIIDTNIKETLKAIVVAKYDLTPTELSKFDGYLEVFNNLDVVETH